MKVLFIYSRLTGNSSFIKRLSFIEQELKKKYEQVDMIETHTLDELKDQCLKACKEYDYLFFVGGDGTVNTIVNYISNEDRKPILGYIPGGTTNDFAKNFKLKKNIKKAVDVLVNGEPVSFDILKANDRYLTYVLACGVFSEISYTAKRNTKKKIGPLAYYGIAIKDLFVRKNIEGTLIVKDKTYDIKTPFLLVLNSKHVGGFYVHLKNKMNDGKFSIFATKPGLLNGLFHYLFFKVRTLKILTDEFTFKFKDQVDPWCLDGEMAKLGDVHVKCLPSHLKILVSKKVVKKFVN